MNPNFGFDLELYTPEGSDVSGLLAQFLNDGHLALLLGGGVSVDLKFPGWSKLLFLICDKHLKGRMEIGKTYSGHELKDIAQDVKNEITKQGLDYLAEVKEALYDGVTFDFEFAKKDLLIALSALITGRHRGNVRNIITYNFDSALEWYLELMGLKVDTFVKRQFMTKNADVVIAHIHGYLPHDSKFGKNSKEITFSNEEFQDRMLGKDYWKEYFFEYFRRHTFLAVGLSADSLYNDVCPYLRVMNKWYKDEGVTRSLPYGIAFLTPGPETDRRIPALLEAGIIPRIYKPSEIPQAIFSILQSALTLAKKPTI
ncbi:SIR2 family protein [Hufsiella ginkgonis]|uniref:SIR2 family protein n=1 Tax=Hufsiella ginkgonis TaxID=2695274 RepID=A0A7K1XZV4_9SPHI|nr:SIR2 family protein [Hufsiella ginkgonis]MXV16500.1 hypothetical protein [Hufsiella ginkgonis]